MRPWCALPLLAFLAACNDDFDGDGWRGKDCDDTNPDVSPDATEVCNGIDDDCDGFVDEGVSLVAYWDRDGDGYGDQAYVRRVCAMPADGAAQGGDCDDEHASIHPDATEVCNGVDDDCDLDVDEDAVTTFYADTDGDGHGDPGGTTTTGCTAPSGYAPDALDCDDSDPLAWTDAPELCDDHDNDCDGQVDEDLPPTRVWADADGDGHGDPDAPGLWCGQAGGWSLDAADCDDTDASVGPDAVDVPGDGKDEDCDGWIDEIAVPDEYATIDDALAAATPGSVVQVGAGIWYDTVDLSGLDITFAGEGCDTVIYGSGAGPVVVTTGSDVRDMTIAGGLAENGGGLSVLGDTTVHGVCLENDQADVKGGAIAVAAGHLVLEDSLVLRGIAGEDGGGLWISSLASAEVWRTTFIEDECGDDGGAIKADGPWEVHGSVFVGNAADSSGGAITAIEDGTIDQCTFDANTAVDHGQAVASSGANLLVEDALFTDHAATTPVTYATTGTWTWVSPAFWNNAGPDTYSGWIVDAVRGDPRYLDPSPSVPEAIDLRLGHGSPLIDAGDPAVLDPDGSRADVGAFGGPGAAGDFSWGYGVDSDADGLPDGWEATHGLNPWVDDAALDGDGDGLDGTGELAADCDPSSPDSDGDGVSDGDEVTGGGAPTDPSDERPTADAGSDGWALPAAPFVLDAGASWDPNGDALAFTWTVLSVPSGSAVTAVDDPASAATAFTPDVAGVYTLEVAVSDGSATATDTLDVTVFDAVVVPDDFPTIQAALDDVPTGGAVAVRPGAYDENLDFAGRDIVLFGLGEPDEVVIDGGRRGPVLSAVAGEHPTLARLTLTNGSATNGGGADVEGGGLTLYDVHVVDDVATNDGGGLYLAKASLEMHGGVVQGSRAEGDGGGIYADGGDVTLIGATVAYDTATGKGGGLYLSAPPDVQWLENVVVVGNDAATGGGLYRRGTSSAVDLLDTGFAANTASGDGAAWYVESGTLRARSTLVAWNAGASVLGRAPGAVIASMYGDYADNTGTLFEVSSDDPGTKGGTVLAAPGVVSFTDDGDPSDDVWAPRPGSPLRDAGWPELDDPDGSVADLGPWGGPNAPRGAGRYVRDRDGDGMSDGWELDHGLDPDVPDAAGDLDGDGLSNGDEFDDGTDPTRADTDGDGVSDADEVTAGSDPTDPSDHAPTADAGADASAEIGTAASLDGSASTDPDGDALTYAWTFVSRPTGSALVDADIASAGATASFTPDVRGVYEVALRVSDGHSWSSVDTARVWAWTELRVPSAYPTLAAAMAVVGAYDHVVLEAGDYDGEIDSLGVDFTLEGAGSGQTVIHGEGFGPVVHVALGEDVTVRGVTLTGGLGDDGGGGLVCLRSTVTLDDVGLDRNVGYQGGGASFTDCDVVLTDVDVTDNMSVHQGGGVYSDGSTLDWTGGLVDGNAAPENVGGGLSMYTGVVTVRNVVFTRNQSYTSGEAIYVAAGSSTSTDTFTGTNLTLAGNHGKYGAFLIASGTAYVTDSLFVGNDAYGIYRGSTTAMLVTAYNGFYGNASGTTSPSSFFGSTDVSADPEVVAWDEAEDASADDWRLRDTSPLVDAGDPSLADPDGSRADIGAWGGPDAGAGWDGWIADADADGLADGWETAHGLDPAVAADAAYDDDGDGLTSAQEYAYGTDPLVADSDEDGLDDGIEVAAGKDPADPSDHRPTASAGLDRVGTVGAAVSLDGSKSTDPNSDALTYAWTFSSKPGRSTLTDATLGTSKTASFTPDTPGTFVVSLVVSDVASSSEADLVNVVVAGDLQVPADYATVGEAIDAVASGYAIDVDAGTWPTRADLGGKDVTIRGAGRDLTYLDGEGLGRVIDAEAGEAVSLADLTLTGGFGTRGGALRTDSGTLDLTDVSFEDDHAVYGGALYSSASAITADGLRLVDDVGGNDGGAVYATSKTTVDLSRMLVAGCYANDEGGGFYASDTNGTIANAIFADLYGWAGAGVYMTGTTKPTLAFDQITAVNGDAENSGGFLYQYGGAVTMRNAIIGWNGDDALALVSSATYTQTYGDLYANPDGDVYATTSSCCKPTTGTAGNVAVDPKLSVLSADGDWTDDDFTLQAGSPVIDAGDPSVLDADGTTSDLGAFGGPNGDWTP